MIELSKDESERLARVLNSVLSDLHTEIRHTDDRSYRASLKEDQAFLQSLVQRLEEPSD
jgi:hypothetical protein